MSYASLLERRASKASIDGIEVASSAIHESLKPFQKKIVQAAVKAGRYAVWADTGLGKTRMQLEWARLSADTALVVTPLAVADQTVDEASKIGITAKYVRSVDEMSGPGIYVTNYEMVERFTPSMFGAVVLDEASILKQSDGKTRTMLIQHFRDVPYRSTWTATPAPNDPEELTNQAEFLGHMSRTNMLAAYFVHDQDGWRLKGHAAAPMIHWMTSWAVAVRRPSDMGCDDTGYILPGLNIVSEIVDTHIEADEGELFAATIGGVSGRARVRKQSMGDRVKRAVELAGGDDPVLIWCGLNEEAAALGKAIPDAVNVHGSMSPEDKAHHLRAFAHGEIRVLITKPSIAGMGLNFQHCNRMIFVGLSDSYESYYQCIRRCYRYGQERVVDAHIVLSPLETQIASNVARKERQANKIVDGMIAAARSIK